MANSSISVLPRLFLAITLFFIGCNTQQKTQAAQNIQGIQFEQMKYPYPEKSFQYQDIRVAYLDHGKGRPVIFLHGQASDLLNFEPVYPLFEKEYRIIAIDYPGFGKSDKPLIKFSEEFYVGLLDKLFNLTGIDTATLVGHSYGGYVAMVYGASRPDRVSSMVLISPAGIQEYSGVVKRAMRNSFTVDAIVSTPVEKSLSNYEFSTVNKTPEVDQYAKRRAALLKNGGEEFRGYAHAMVQAMELMLETNIRDRIGRAEVPTLLVWGKEDPLVPYKISKQTLNCIPQARLVTIEKCGHFPMLEYPQKLYEIVNTYLQEQG